MGDFVVELWSKYGILPVAVKQLSSTCEDCLFEYEVWFTYESNNLYSTLTLDASDWFPPLILDDSQAEPHQPKVFTFCHDGKLNYSDAQALGQVIMSHMDCRIEAARIESIKNIER